MADFTKLNADIQALAAQVAATKTVEDSAEVLLNGQAAAIATAVTAALAADDAADAGSIAAAQTAIETANSQFAASAGLLGNAVVAGTPASGSPPSNPAPAQPPITGA